MVEVLEYVDNHDRSPYAEWFDELEASAAAKVTTAIIR